jgi:hypothetical protein
VTHKQMLDPHWGLTVVDGYTTVRRGMYGGMKYYTRCAGCGNGARKRKHVQHRRSCPALFVKMCEQAEKVFGKQT